MPDVGSRQVAQTIEEGHIEHSMLPPKQMKVYVTTGVGKMVPATGVEVVIMRDEINVPILVIKALGE